MPDQLQLRGGTTTEHNSFTGAAREVTVDTTKKTLVVHDGSQAGGTPLMKEAGANGAASVILGSGGVNAFTIDSNQDITFTGASANVVFDKSDNAFEFADDAQAKFGTDGDLAVYYNNTSDRSIIASNGARLDLRSDAVHITSFDVGETMATFTDNGAVELYYDNVKRLETLSTGVDITGDLVIDGDAGGTLTLCGSSAHTSKLVIASNAGNTNGNLLVEGGDGGDFFTINSAGNVVFEDNKKAIFGGGGDLEIYHKAADNGNYIESQNSRNLFLEQDQIFILNQAGNEYMIHAIADGATSLYYNNGKKFETRASAVAAFGDVICDSDSHKFKACLSGDMTMYHNGTHSYLQNNTGNLYITNQNSRSFFTNTNEDACQMYGNGAVELYYDNSKKAETNADGFRVNGALQSSSGTGNYYLRTAHTTIQEGGNSVTITLSGLTFSWGVLRIGGYASAGQASVSLHILFGGYMTQTANYSATVLDNHAQGSSISLSKNASNYVITITNNAANYDLFCNMMIESANSAFAMAIT